MSADGPRPTVGLIGRLALAAAGVGVLAAVAGTAVLASYGHASLRREIDEQFRDTAARLAFGLDDRVGSVVESMRVVARSQDVVSLSPAASGELSATIAVSDHFDSLVLLDADGHPVAAEGARQLLRASGLPSRPEVVEELRGSLLWVHVDRQAVPELQVAVPVEDPPGRLVGALTGVVRLDVLGARVESARLRETGVARLVDRHGTTLVHPDHGRVINAEQFPFAALLRDGAPTGVGTVTIDGVQWLAAAATTSVFPGTVIVEQPMSEAMAPARSTLGGLVLILVATLTMTVAAVGAFGTALLRPVRHVAQAAAGFGRGSRDVRVDVPGRDDEAALLAAEFNRMADAIDAHLGELEATNTALTRSQERFQSAVDQSPIGITVLRTDGVIAEVNPAMCRLLGRSAQDLIGVGYQSLMHPDDVVASRDDLAAVCRGDVESYQAEHRCIRPDGSVIWGVLNVSRMADASGTAQLFAQLQDISVRKAAEEELRRLDAAKTEFVANAAHELRTPLSAIALLSELVATRRDQMSAEQLRQSVEALSRQGARARTLVHNLLDLVRVDAGVQRMAPQPVEVRAAAESAVGAARVPGDVDLPPVEVKVPPGLLAVADPQALEQVLVNLLTNAFRYGGQHVSIDAASTNGAVFLAVSDDGSGVPEDLEPLLFEPFRRGREEARGQGSGLGLTIARALCEAFGGHLRYERTPSRGTTFVLELPSAGE